MTCRRRSRSRSKASTQRTGRNEGPRLGSMIGMQGEDDAHLADGADHVYAAGKGDLEMGLDLTNLTRAPNAV